MNDKTHDFKSAEASGVDGPEQGKHVEESRSGTKGR